MYSYNKNTTALTLIVPAIVLNIILIKIMTYIWEQEILGRLGALILYLITDQTTPLSRTVKVSFQFGHAIESIYLFVIDPSRQSSKVPIQRLYCSKLSQSRK